MYAKSRSVVLCLFVLGVTLAVVGLDAAEADTVIPTDYTVTGTEIWDYAGSPYIVQGSLSIADMGHLTLEPGVEVQIESGRVFDVQGGGTLAAEGTEMAPITITSISGHFIGLRLWSGAHVSLQYCDISSAGDSAWPPVDIQATDVIIDHCTIRDSGVGSSRAIQVSGSGLSPALSNTRIENNSGYAIYQSTIDMTPTYLNLTLAGNGTDAVVWNGGTLNRPLTLDGAQLDGSPFIALDDVSVESGAYLTLTAGTELLMSAAHGLWVDSGGTLAAEGTEASPVTLAARDSGAPFIGLFLLPGSSASLARCDIHHAGASGYPAMDIQSSDVILDHCILHDNGVGSGRAVQLTGAGLSPTFLNTTIQNNSGYAIYQSTIDMTPIYQALTLSGNGTDAVAWHSGYLNRDLTLDGQQIGGSPFISLQSINVNSGGHLTLSLGTELQMQTGRGLWVQSGGTLTADGTSSEPTVLTALDPNASFVKLSFLPGSMGSLTYFDLSRAGASSSPALEIQSSDVVVNHSAIHDNVAGSGAAVILNGIGLSPTIANTTIQDNSGRALHQSTIDMTPVYTNLTFSGNGTDAVVFGAGDLNRTVILDGPQLNGSPFISLDDINVWSNGHLTLAPGTELRMMAGKAIYVEPGGALIADGTAAQPVAVTSVEPAEPYLKVHFLPDSTSSLSYCDISQAGGSGFDALAVYSPDVSITHCIVHDNAARGMRLFQGAGNPVLDNVVFMDNAGGGLLVESGVSASLRHTTFARNVGDGLRVRDGGMADLTNTIVAGHETGLRVDHGGSATVAYTLWDGNAQDIVGDVDETGHIEGPAAFDADGYHLTGSSSALQQGVDSGVLDDIDGESRPQPDGTAPDLGADESPAVQVGDIYMRDNLLDDGSVPSSGMWWISPDIWVRNNDAGDCSVTGHQNPIAGTINTLCVRVRNRLATAVGNITVDLYWAGAALGISWPEGWSHFDSFTILTLAPGGEVITPVLWNVPSVTGHFCFLARADAAGDPIDTGLDTIEPTDVIKNNNNITQKNTHIVNYLEVTGCGFNSTERDSDIVFLDVVNTSNSTKTVDIEFSSSDFPLDTGGIAVAPGELRGRWSDLTNFREDSSTLILTAFPASMDGIPMGPYETARITMTINAEIDERFVVDIGEYVDNEMVGGIQYVRKLPYCAFLPLAISDTGSHQPDCWKPSCLQMYLR
jgi:hypothetical protein